MAVYTSINGRNHIHNNNEEKNHQNQINEYDEEIEETEEDLIENYLYLTKRCGALRHSPTANTLATLQHQQHINQSALSRQYSLAIDNHPIEYERSYPTLKSHSSLNDFNNNTNYQKDYSIESRVPPTIYYDGNDDDNSSFSLVKLFARMKTRLKHDRRYRPKSTHALLREEDSPEWYELTKNIHSVLTKALLPDGGYDVVVRKKDPNYHQHRHNSQKKSRGRRPVLSDELENDEDKIKFEIDDELNTEGDPEFDQIIRENFRKCLRGYSYRRYGVCKAIDRQYFQGQLVYVYGVANNILIDENLKASGLG